MGSFVAYYRPRGIAGNYIVAIFLDLAKTESAKVVAFRKRCQKSCKCCGLLTPDNVTQIFDLINVSQPEERILEIYRLERIIFDDSFSIEIHDRDVIFYQRDSFEVRSGYRLRNEEDKLEKFSDSHVIFNEIQLIDWDKQMFEDDTENKRVEDVLFRSN